MIVSACDGNTVTVLPQVQQWCAVAGTAEVKLLEVQAIKDAACAEQARLASFSARLELDLALKVGGVWWYGIIIILAVRMCV